MEDIESLPSTQTMQTIATKAKADYTVLVTKATDLVLGEGALERMARAADDSGAVMVYANSRERKAESGECRKADHRRCRGCSEQKGSRGEAGHSDIFRT